MFKKTAKRSTPGIWILPLAVVCLAGFRGSAAGQDAAKIPVILDTDIGDDIDDTWALALLLKSPQFDLKLVTTTYGKAEYRAKLIAKLLTVAGRSDVPVGLGAGGRAGTGGQEAWIGNYDLRAYPGKVYDDGVQALIDTIEASPRPVVLISIGPSTTVAEALKRRPELASKAVFVGMQGSIRKGYGGGAVCAEWNVKADVPAARKALLAPWKRIAITPLDTCGLIRLGGERFRILRDSPDALLKAVMENYRLWAKKATVGELKESSVLFDTVAVYLADPGPGSLLVMEELTLGVTPEGMMRLDPAGRAMSAATSWKDLDGFADLLVKKLLR
jgi:inosine-uridine nucleoside N-ribohydrolase